MSGIELEQNVQFVLIIFILSVVGMCFSSHEHKE